MPFRNLDHRQVQKEVCRIWSGLYKHLVLSWWEDRFRAQPVAQCNGDSTSWCPTNKQKVGTGWPWNRKPCVRSEGHFELNISQMLTHAVTQEPIIWLVLGTRGFQGQPNGHAWVVGGKGGGSWQSMGGFASYWPRHSVTEWHFVYAGQVYLFDSCKVSGKARLETLDWC